MDRIRITLIQGDELLPPKNPTPCYPYCILTLANQRYTSSVQCGKSVVWNESYLFSRPAEDLTLTIQTMNKDPSSVRPGTPIGNSTIDLSCLAEDTATEELRTAYGVLTIKIEMSVRYDDASQTTRDFSSKVPPRIIITGAPASGKGTQCERIVAKYGVVHISTGDLLRAAVKEGTPLGKQAFEYMNTGRLVPDQLVIDLVKEKLSSPECTEHGWLLDGFPRSEAQAIALRDAGITPTHVILLDVPDEVLMDRALGRRLDPVTGKIYHIRTNPPPADIASRCIQRSDDMEEKVRTRLEQYHRNLQPLCDAYRELLVSVKGNQAPDAVFAEVDAILSA